MSRIAHHHRVRAGLIVSMPFVLMFLTYSIVFLIWRDVAVAFTAKVVAAGVSAPVALFLLRRQRSGMLSGARGKDGEGRDDRAGL